MHSIMFLHGVWLAVLCTLTSGLTEQGVHFTHFFTEITRGIIFKYISSMLISFKTDACLSVFTYNVNRAAFACLSGEGEICLWKKVLWSVQSTQEWLILTMLLLMLQWIFQLWSLPWHFMMDSWHIEVMGFGPEWIQLKLKSQATL